MFGSVPHLNKGLSWVEAHSDMNEFGALNGYALVILSTIPGKEKNALRVVFACDPSWKFS